MSIIAHSREFPHLIESKKHVDQMCVVHKRKGFHKKPSYGQDVKKHINETSVRTLVCREIVSAFQAETLSSLVAQISQH